MHQHRFEQYWTVHYIIDTTTITTLRRSSSTKGATAVQEHFSNIFTKPTLIPEFLKIARKLNHSLNEHLCTDKRYSPSWQMILLQKWQTTSLSSCKLQAQQQSTLFFFLLYFASLLSPVPRENWGCYHPHLAECIEIWAHLRQNPCPPLFSRAYPPSTDSQGAELVQTAPLYVHHNKVHTAQHGCIFAIFTVCKTDLIALHPLTRLSACQWNALWLQWLVTHPPQTIQEPVLFWPSVTILSYFLGVLAFLDSWLLIVSLSLADLMGLLAAESQWWFDCSYVSLIWQRPQSKLQNMQIWTTLITRWNISDYTVTEL